MTQEYNEGAFSVMLRTPQPDEIVELLAETTAREIVDRSDSIEAVVEFIESEATLTPQGQKFAKLVHKELENCFNGTVRDVCDTLHDLLING